MARNQWIGTNYENACFLVLYVYHLPNKLTDGNVFTHVYVCVCVYPQGGVPFDHYPWCIGPPSMSPAFPSDMWPHCTGTPMLEPSGGNHWRPVQMFTSRPPSPIGADIWWLLKHIRMYSRRNGAVHTLVECFLVQTVHKRGASSYMFLFGFATI